MKTAMILAAGRGERLKPITNYLAKAMCLVNNKPLIEHHVVNLANAGFEHIVINHAYLGYQIRHHLGNGRQWGVDISYSVEPPGGLETGGGLYNARALLGSQPFITVNADIFTNFNFKSLKLPAHSLSHLILGNNPSHNINGDFGLINQQQLVLINKKYTFLGIACYHPDAFLSCQPGRYSVVPLLYQLIAQQQASGQVFHGLWVDIGTPKRLKLANDIGTTS